MCSNRLPVHGVILENKIITSPAPPNKASFSLTFSSELLENLSDFMTASPVSPVKPGTRGPCPQAPPPPTGVGPGEAPGLVLSEDFSAKEHVILQEPRGRPSTCVFVTKYAEHKAHHLNDFFFF